jgi:hypothetical protein
VTARPSITGRKTAPPATGADDAASVNFSYSGGIMLSGVAELSVFAYANGMTEDQIEGALDDE